MRISKSVKFSLVFIFSFVFLFSCKKDASSWKSNVISSVKENVIVITSVDFMSILDDSGIMTSEYLPIEYQSILSMYVKNTLKSDEIGLKLEGNNHIVLVANDDGDPIYGFTMMDVIHPEKIAKSIKLVFGGRKDEVDDYTYVTSNDVSAGWDEKHCILVFAFDDTRSPKELRAEAEYLLKQRFEDQPADADLISYLNRKDDLNTFLFMEPYIKMIQKFSKTEIQFEDDYYTSLVNAKVITAGNFNKGNISFTTQFIGSEFLKSKYNFFKDSPTDKEYLNYVSDDDKLLFCAFANLELPPFIQFYKNSLEGQKPFREFNQILDQLGMNISDLENLFDGQLSFSFLDLLPEKNFSINSKEEAVDEFGEWADDFTDEMSEYGDFDDDFFNDMDGNYSSNSELLPNVLITLGVNDQKALKKVLSITNIDLKDDQVQGINDIFFILLKDNKFFIGSDKELLAKIQGEGQLKSYAPIKNLTHPIMGYVNTDSKLLPDILSSMIEDEIGDSYINVLNKIKYIEIKGSAEESSFQLVMEDDNENALKQLIDLALKEFLSSGLEGLFM